MIGEADLSIGGAVYLKMTGRPERLADGAARRDAMVRPVVSVSVSVRAIDIQPRNMGR